MHSCSLSTYEHRALNQLTRVRASHILTFHRLFINETMLHSTQYGWQGGKRNSTICSFRSNGSQFFDVIRKFCLCECSPVYIALISPFQLTNRSILNTSGNPGREILCQYAEVDLLSSFVIQVAKQSLHLIAVPTTDILDECVKVSGKLTIMSSNS